MSRVKSMRGSEPASPRAASTVVLSRELSAQQGFAGRVAVVVVVAGFMFYVVGRGSGGRRGERSIRITKYYNPGKEAWKLLGWEMARAGRWQKNWSLREESTGAAQPSPAQAQPSPSPFQPSQPSIAVLNVVDAERLRGNIIGSKGPPPLKQIQGKERGSTACRKLSEVKAMRLDT
ncbi:hypothetical protein O3P69_004362 [Scylla paramamosain]|uniref:Uncharacterized protein n=1 Tax=Scylla paramamosain TaxID=85552 RepID=A0AAW0UFA1_SCYPA